MDFFPVERLRDGNLELELLRTEGFGGAWVPQYAFGMREPGNSARAGHINLRIGSDETVFYMGHIGYAVVPKFQGRHYAARAVRLVLPVAARHGLRHVWITANPDNWPSRRACELAGATLIDTVDLPPGDPMYERGERQKCRYRLAVDG